MKVDKSDNVVVPASYLLYLIIGTFCMGGIMGMVFGYQCKQCPEIASTKVEVRDSIVRVRREPIVISGNPKLVQVRKHKATKTQVSKHSEKDVNYKFESIHVDTSTINVETCLDTNFYEKLTYYPDSFRARASAQVAGNELVSWAFEFENLKPEVIRIIERTTIIEKKQSLVKVYAGVYAKSAFTAVKVANFGGGLALDGIIKDKHLIGLQGGINSQLQGEVGIRYGVKISFRK